MITRKMITRKNMKMITRKNMKSISAQLCTVHMGVLMENAKTNQKKKNKK